MLTSIRPYSAAPQKMDAKSQNKRQFTQNHYSSPSFGCSQKSLNAFDKFVIKLAENSTVKKLMDWAFKEKTVKNKNGENVVKRNSDRLNQLLIIAFSAFLQSNHVVNILRNKEMPDDRKEVLAVNNGLTFVIPTVGALTVDGALNKKLGRLEKYVKDVNDGHISEKALKGLKTAKTILVFSMMYKYASTLIAMPIADGCTRFLRRHGAFGEERKQVELQREKEAASKKFDKKA